MAVPLIKYLRADGWDVYQEVQVRRYDRVADIAVVRDGLLWIIEIKTSLSFAVIEQAMHWIGTAHFVSVGVPIRANGRGTRLAEQVCAERGIGIIEISSRVAKERVYKRLNRSAHLAAKAFIENLCEQHKTFAQAGNPDAKRFTPFADTIQQLKQIVSDNPGIRLREAVEKLRHHYVSDQSARYSLSKWIRIGKVKGISMDGSNLYGEES